MERIAVQEIAEYNRSANEDTASARATLLELLNKPESIWISVTPTIISYIVIVGFLGFVALLVSQFFRIPDTGRATEIIYLCVGALTAGFSTVLNFWLGSSLGSRRKDNAVALSGSVDKVRELTAPTHPPAPQRDTGAVSKESQPPPTKDAPTGVGKKDLPLPSALVGVSRSTDSSTINVRKDIPKVGDNPASLRYNNPGAQYPSREAARFGQIGYGIIGGGHKIATFPSPVNGAAANFDLLFRKYVGLTIGEAGKKWTGNLSFGVPTYDSNIGLTQEMLNDSAQAIAFLKEIAKRESGKGDNLTEEQWRYAHEMFRSGSADAFLDQFGIDVRTASAAVRPDDAPRELLEALIVKALEQKKYSIDRDSGKINIVYVEGMNEDGSPNNDEPNKFNDLRCVIGFKNGNPIMINKWNSTTEPGFHYDRDHPMRKEGAARIQFGQYKAWRVGIHRGNHEALVQVGDVTVCRDLNRDMERVGDALHTGNDFGINQHAGYDQPEDDIGKASAGCLVGRTMSGHRQFMEAIKEDPRYVSDKNFIFSTTVLPAGDVLQAGA